jgi:hypothetical protein
MAQVAGSRNGLRWRLIPSRASSYPVMGFRALRFAAAGCVFVQGSSAVKLLPTAIDRLHIPDPRQKAVLQGNLQRAATAALVCGGRRAFEATERLAAYHEAGHAVLYALAGIPLAHLWIKPVKAGGAVIWIGECQPEAWSW